MSSRRHQTGQANAAGESNPAQPRKKEVKYEFPGAV
jgi:hypothetical protein